MKDDKIVRLVILLSTMVVDFVINIILALITIQSWRQRFSPLLPSIVDDSS